MNRTSPNTLASRLIVSVALGLLSVATAATVSTENHTFKGSYSDNELARVDALLEDAVRNTPLPGMVAGITTSEDALFVRAKGVRRLDKPDPLEPDDLIHIGSCTKAMTATLMALLVEAGLLEWNSSPQGPAPRRPTSTSVTLHKLLSHTAGIQPFTSIEGWQALSTFEGDIMERRRAFTQWLLERTNPDYGYSNAGYAMAASVAESATGLPWETLITEWLFEPLGIDCFFGWPALHDPNQPWGALAA